ncbi:MAG: thioesterase family protein [Chloroflexi bacterium]|nr:thioesterase family protein [Chloroflexota bacterium]
MTLELSTSTTPLDSLLEKLNLERLDRDLFLGDPGEGQFRLFGGMVAAQAVAAAYRTVPGHGVAAEPEASGDGQAASLHSMHAYFLRPGRYDTPVRYVVYRIRDGRSFTTRDVVAHQAGEAIFNLSCSFVKPEEGVSHQEAAPSLPGPEGLPAWEFMRPDRHEEREMMERWERQSPIEMRTVDAGGGKRQTAGGKEQTAKGKGRAADGEEQTAGGKRQTAKGKGRAADGEGQTAKGKDDDIPRRRVWIRPRGELPDVEAVHAAVLAYASDMGLIATAHITHNLPRPSAGHSRFMGASASLDHAMWFHRPPRFDGWMLYTSESPIAHAARAMIYAQMWREDGVLVASVVQEGLIRIPKA